MKPKGEEHVETFLKNYPIAGGWVSKLIGEFAELVLV